jgi:hypothetical protein
MGAYVATKSVRRAARSADRLMEGMDQQIQEMQDSRPGIEEKPAWDKDILTMKLVFTSQKKNFTNLTITSLLLDNYLPDKKVPFKVPSFGPKSKPLVVLIKFPGFDGRGGKYAKLNLQYQMKGGGPKIDPTPIPGEDPHSVSWPDPQDSVWSSSETPSIYIPLRASAKTH